MGVAYTNFISNLLSVVFAKYTNKLGYLNEMSGHYRAL